MIFGIMLQNRKLANKQLKAYILSIKYTCDAQSRNLRRFTSEYLRRVFGYTHLKTRKGNYIQLNALN